MNEVNTNTMATMPKTIANVPEITFVKYKTATTIAIKIRMILSDVPMFFFMIRIFGLF